MLSRASEIIEKFVYVSWAGIFVAIAALVGVVPHLGYAGIRILMGTFLIFTCAGATSTGLLSLIHIGLPEKRPTGSFVGWAFSQALGGVFFLCMGLTVLVGLVTHPTSTITMAIPHKLLVH